MLVEHGIRYGKCYLDIGFNIIFKYFNSVYKIYIIFYFLCQIPIVLIIYFRSLTLKINVYIIFLALSHHNMASNEQVDGTGLEVCPCQMLDPKPKVLWKSSLEKPCRIRPQ